MRRILFPLVTLFAIGCSDSLPQLMNEASQNKAEFVDKLMLITDEETCDRYYKRAEKSFQDRNKEIEERIAKAVYNLNFESIESAIKKGGGRPGAALMKLDNWVAQAMLLQDAMMAKRDYIIADHFTEARLSRERKRLKSLESALGGDKNAPKVAAMNVVLNTPTKNDGPIPNGFNYLKGVPPHELFMAGDPFKIDFEVINLPPAPRYTRGDKKVEKVDLALNQADLIFKRLRESKSSAIYSEGLPHFAKEKAAFDAEKPKVNQGLRHGERHLFYNQTRPLDNENKKLIDTLTDVRNYKVFALNLGANFHADWLLEWTVELGDVAAFVSASTNQVHFIMIEDTPTKLIEFHLKCDMTQPTTDQLRALLRPHRTKRPAPGP